jgi:hypothetical protein
MHLKKNEGQEAKIGLFQGCVPVRGGRHKERVIECEFGGCSLYPHMKIEE